MKAPFSDICVFKKFQNVERLYKIPSELFSTVPTQLMYDLFNLLLECNSFTGSMNKKKKKDALIIITTTFIDRFFHTLIDI